MIWSLDSDWQLRLDRLRRGIVLLAGFSSALSLLGLYGLRQGNVLERHAAIGLIVATVALALESLLAVLRAPHPWDSLRRRPFGPALLLLLLIQLTTLRFSPAAAGFLARHWSIDLTYVYLLLLQGYVLASLAVTAVRWNRRLSNLRVRPWRLVLLLFVTLIGLGTLLLKLPRMTPEEFSLSWVDALFTATSSVCVTGLVVTPTGSSFTPEGHFVIGLLIQLGGLGIMVVTGFLALLSGSALGIRERALLADVLHTEFLGQVGRQLRNIVLLTFILEAIGVTLLAWNLVGVEGLEDRWSIATFHAVSAFCNAGFSTFDENLVRLGDRVGAQSVLMGLIACGSLGAPVLLGSLAWLRGRARGRQNPMRATLRLIWTLMLALWLGGALLFAVVEWNGALADLSWPRRLVAALFSSVTARTAGFNTLDLASYSATSHLLFMLLMFVGGAPGSTAGGIKVTTVGVMGAVVGSLLRAREQVVLFGRGVARQSVREATAMAFIGALVLVVALLGLLTLQDQEFLPLAFECVSALATTGLSLGATEQLGTAGRLLLVLLMIVGRIGPLGLVLAIGGPRSARERYPHESVAIG